MLKGLLSPEECRALAALYPDDKNFRSRIVMGRHGFGRGEYKYFAYPLPDLIAELRPALYARLCGIANRWNETMGIDIRYPDRHEAFLKRCHDAGQTRPTPLLLQYGAGDYNCLHQDLYGEHVFPLQVAILLSEPGRDFTGGEFVLTEQRPRMQSRPEVVPLRQGDAVAFAVHHRPVQGTRGPYRVNLRHGVSRIRSGHRHTVGVIFHDARSECGLQLTADLFEAVPDVRPSREAMAEGAVLLRGFAKPFESEVIAALREIVAQAPFRRMFTPGGHQMSVAMTNCGNAGWVTDRSGYRYDGIDPEFRKALAGDAGGVSRAGARRPPQRAASTALRRMPA